MKKIIIADDVCELLKTEKSFLNRADILIFRAESNRAALVMHRKEQADLIIARLDSSDMSGEELCAAVRKDKKLMNVSMIIICDKPEVDVERCTVCRANAFMTSPVSTAVLLQEAHQLLHIASRRQARALMTLRIEGVSKGRSISCEVENISTSGVLIRTNALLYEGDEFTCSIAFSNRIRIQAAGDVVRVLRKKRGVRHGYGIRFSDISPSHIKRLEEFISKQRP